ncbi:RDD family protein [Dactylosporangium sp. NBC_01737]|uniref:RDD family protein n=1 Tax=Dactylosporangium sp. NBC_01737 TaxID=2975959 RepID=UPI002E0FE3FF|nr:RDD family protein [Dactylosporangium sp. NBC_01737]
MNLATWPVRVGAYIVDLLPYIVVVMIGSLIGDVVYYLSFAVGIAWLVYNRWILGGQGQSWGKKLLGLRLIKEETGQPIGAGMAFVRDIVHFVDAIICFVGFLFPLWDAKRQTLSDKILGTVVTKV